MKRKKIMALLMSLTVSAGVAFGSVSVANAQTLTQVTSADKIVYGTLSDAEKKMFEKIFDDNFYKTEYEDVRLAVGETHEALFNHFVTFGYFEGRACRAGFDPSAYASAYSDLAAAYGNDIAKYYEHYFTIGINEGRDLITIEACANAGITVTSLFDSSVRITPNIYSLASSLGTTDYDVLSKAVSYASSGSSSSSSSSSASASSSNTGSVAITPATTSEQEMNEAGYKKIGTITMTDIEGKYVEYFVYASDNSSYGIYEAQVLSIVGTDVQIDVQKSSAELLSQGTPVYTIGSFDPASASYVQKLS